MDAAACFSREKRDVPVAEVARTRERMRAKFCDPSNEKYVNDADLRRMLSWTTGPLFIREEDGAVKCVLAVSTLHDSPTRLIPGHSHRIVSLHGVQHGFHRLFYRLFNGSIGKDAQGKPLFVLHNCHGNHGSCVQPHHLRTGTAAENVAQRIPDGTYLRHARGERTNCAKLTAEQVTAIRNDYANRTIKRKDVAEKYGVSVQTINNVGSGRTWLHLLPGALPPSAEIQVLAPIKFKGKSQPGERNGRAKLKDAERRAIRREYAAGNETHDSLAKKYGVSASVIGKTIHKAEI